LIAFIIIVNAIICDIFITDSNVQKFIAFGTISAAIGAIIALIFVMQQANQLKESVNLQTVSFNLEQRPYIFAYLGDITFFKNVTDGSFYGIGNLYFENKGKVPADFIFPETKYIIASDELGKIGNERWYDEKAGGYPHVKVVFPGQKGLFIPVHPQVGKKPSIIYVGAVITYKGTDPNRQYWYKFSQVFYISYNMGKNGKGQPFIESTNLGPSSADHSWDMNADAPPPELNIPDWGKLKNNAIYFLEDKPKVIVEKQEK